MLGYLPLACKRGVILNCLDRDGRVCYGECRWRTSRLQERLASNTGRAAHSRENSNIVMTDALS